jgi:DNA-binding response OmpR family regulator
MNLNPEHRSRARILVVDDVEGNRAVVCRRLEQSGFTLFQAESGEQALRSIKVDQINLVLLDYMMPNMNGIDVLKVVRKDWQMIDLPVIMLTARAEAQAQVEALAAGADDYVTKPIDFEVLLARIESQLSRHENHDLLRLANAALDERAAIRVLAIDQLQLELQAEMSKRRAAEAELETMRDSGAPVARADLREDAERGPANPQIERAIDIVDSIGRALDQGKPINRALLTSLKKMLVTAIHPD